MMRAHGGVDPELPPRCGVNWLQHCSPPTDEEGSREGRRLGCAGSGGQSHALRWQPGASTGGDRIPAPPAGRGAAHGLPCPQRSSPVPPHVAGCPKQSEQTGAGGRAGMIPALIISVPPYISAAAHRLLHSAAKHYARWTKTRATGSAQKLPVQHSQPATAPLADSGSPRCPHASEERDERHQLKVLWDGTHEDTPSCAPTSSFLMHTHPYIASPQGWQNHPGQASSQGVKVPCYSFHTWAPLICRLNFPEAKAFY